MLRCTINSDPAAVKIIVEQNDRFRSEILTTKPKTVQGRLTLSPRVRMMDPEFIDALLLGLGHAWNAHPLTDPHSERDCGEFTVRDQKLVWQIDFMAADHRAYVASDRTDVERTWRVLTVKVAGDADSRRSSNTFRRAAPPKGSRAAFRLLTPMGGREKGRSR